MIPVSSLAEAVAFLGGAIEIDPVSSRLEQLFSELSRHHDDYADLRGQEMAKRALIIAAAGAHKLLMLGLPGSCKREYMPQLTTVDPAAAFPRSCRSPLIHMTGKRPVPLDPIAVESSPGRAMGRRGPAVRAPQSPPDC